MMLMYPSNHPIALKPNPQASLNLLDIPFPAQNPHTREQQAIKDRPLSPRWFP
jgi:hypothetical protein